METTKLERRYDPYNQKPVEYYDTKVAKDIDERKVKKSDLKDNRDLQSQSLQQLDQVCLDFQIFEES